MEKEQVLPLFESPSEKSEKVGKTSKTISKGSSCVIEQDLFSAEYRNDEDAQGYNVDAEKKEEASTALLQTDTNKTKRMPSYRGRPMKRVHRGKQHEKKDYLHKISAETLENVTNGIIDILMLKKGYKSQRCSARKLASQLHTNTRYISIAVSRRFHLNFSTLVNKLRVEEAMSMMEDNKYQNYRMEDISDAVGFSNRQTFYTSFQKYCKMTPNAYRQSLYD